ncbi:hypothetical protein [Streptomyces noursei]|uniref:hypothetical protein n=1 Tax=Streptomyces noursei TaxID=1971 RepID=UPI0011AFCB91|nr:hypothetical protein [Streptomyces noursei]
MSDGIQGLIDREDDWYHHVIFARGITPEGLAPRRGGRPGSVPSPITADEAEALTGDYGTDDEDLIRISSSGAWSIALEYGLPTGRERLAEISRDEVEVVHLDPQPDHPPKMFAYARNGVEVCSFGIGEEHAMGRTAGLPPARGADPRWRVRTTGGRALQGSRPRHAGCPRSPIRPLPRTRP